VAFRGEDLPNVATEALRRQLSYLVRSASIELTCREIFEVAPYRKFLAPGTQVYVPHTPGARSSDTISAAKMLVADRMVPIPHIAARRLKSEAEFVDVLDQLREVGCKQALIIGGSVGRPEGPYGSSLDLLQSGKLERAGFTRIGVAGHPGGSPDISSEKLREAYLAKRSLAAAGKFEMYIVTQFAFEAELILDWEQGLRNIGNRLPVHVGLPGVTSGAKLLKFAAICGVKASASFLRTGTQAMVRLLSRWHPGALATGIAQQTVDDIGCMIRQLHFFPFGGFLDTVSWMKSIGEGRFTLDKNGGSLDIVIEEETN